MASGGWRRKPRGGGSRPNKGKKKKRTKYLSLSRIIVKAEVGTPPPRSPEDDDDTAPASPPSPPSPPHPQWEEEPAEVKKEEEDGGLGQQQQHAEPFAPLLLLQHEASTLFAALPAPSLSDIFGTGASSSAGGDESPSASPAGFLCAEGEDLARRALRGRERWVYCCSSTSPSPSPTTTATTTTSSSSPCSSSAASTGASARSLLLKLDYDEILAAWADRGSLYIRHAAPKPEPPPEPAIENVLVEVEEPPRHPAAAAAGSGRAESLRRYKEKRRNRMFAHQTRYEVRRAIAVRRPRLKGRFIKEHEEIVV
ncbi:hypothetical protein QOZ80_8BG0643270 [Eleusine coracana subsp. coracana]|nr:hypothetical protein QOZ80_8BG0643270 [Eleusine coracana subsp. coracana]